MFCFLPIASFTTLFCTGFLDVSLNASSTTAPSGITGLSVRSLYEPLVATVAKSALFAFNAISASCASSFELNVCNTLSTSDLVYTSETFAFKSSFSSILVILSILSFFSCPKALEIISWAWKNSFSLTKPTISFSVFLIESVSCPFR